jgi:hypothetical protein
LITGLALASGACGSLTEAAYDDVTLDVQFDTLRNAVGYPLLYATVTATNTGSKVIVGDTWAFCAWEFSAHDNPDRAGAPVWAEDLTGANCPAVGVRLQLVPGATQVFARRFLPRDEILATRGPRMYFFTARLRKESEDWWTARLPAGSVALAP